MRPRLLAELVPDPAVAASCAEILAAIGDPGDLVLVHGEGGPHDELELAGARRLLGDRPYRAVPVAELATTRGATAVLALGGGLCRPGFGVAARSLGVAELRFERVVVLPVAIDPAEDAVGEALVRTRAIVFAADPESHRVAGELCDARLAHPGAFLLDFGETRRGTGTLNAFRTDQEQRADVELPYGNDDISRSRNDLASWLAAIAAHRLVRSDRNHVVLVAALMGREVEFPSDLDPRLGAMVEHWLGDRAVRGIVSDGAGEAPTPAPLEPTTARVMARLRARPSPRRTPAGGEPRVTAILVSRNRPRLVVRALDSLDEAGVPYELLVIDNNCSPSAAAALRAVCRDRPRLRFHRLEQNTRAAGGRQLAAEMVSTEFLLYLDDDAELLPGALADLVADLDAHPEAGAVTATVIDVFGRVMHSGGGMAATEEIVFFWLSGVGTAPEDVPPTGPTGWIAGTAMLARTELLRRIPIDPGMHFYFEDNEWSYRVQIERPGAFRRSREAVALHQTTFKPSFRPTFAGRSLAADYLHTLAHFYRVHGRLMAPWVFGLVPELRGPGDFEDIGGARLVMDLVAAHGSDWLFAAMSNGELAGLLAANRLG